MKSMPFGRRRLLASTAAIAVAPLACACEPNEIARLPRRAAPPPNARPEVLVGQSTLEGRGARVLRLFPQRAGDHCDPFVLLDDFRVAPPAGFPTHPHRGFEAFTYMIDGSFHHADDLGNDSVVASGGTQRFTSGRGAHHSEMPGEPRVNHGLQLWVNLPQRLKQMEPEYAAVHGADIPEESQGDLVVRTVVGAGSPVHLRTDVRFLDLRASRASSFETELRTGEKGLVYVIAGRAKVGDIDLVAGQAALPVPGELLVRAESNARFVVLTGMSHDEPILQRGPYVD